MYNQPAGFSCNHKWPLAIISLLPTRAASPARRSQLLSRRDSPVNIVCWGNSANFFPTTCDCRNVHQLWPGLNSLPLQVYQFCLPVQLLSIKQCCKLQLLLGTSGHFTHLNPRQNCMMRNELKKIKHYPTARHWSGTTPSPVPPFWPCLVTGSWRSWFRWHASNENCRFTHHSLLVPTPAASWHVWCGIPGGWGTRDTFSPK